ncbi:MAG: succinoglycan biosynthesis protein exoa [Croceicoccus sp.]|nr:succinoglycan biosynthesis protein exoa [Croceicoccus sp.]|tara:strand:+ start:6218 stop:7246 length:1029 start_codon:yes stop_codon:yes gene_type:complete
MGNLAFDFATDAETALVAIIIPTLNEEDHIEATLDALARQSLGYCKEIIVVDGGSSDATCAIVRDYADRDDRVRLIHNANRLQSSGINLAVSQLDPDTRYFIRADAHSVYPEDFVEKLLNAAVSSGAQSVVTRLKAEGQTCFQRAVGMVSNSIIGTGGAIHRVGGDSRFVDHGHHALFDRHYFATIGGYDESFATNEDAEFDVRLCAAGGKIWFSNDSTITYLPRSTPKALACQYFAYGAGRARNLMKHRNGLRLRQLLPPLTVLVVSMCMALSLSSPWFLIVPLIYLLAVGFATILIYNKLKARCALAGIIAAPIMHFSWGAGFITGLTTYRRNLPLQSQL